MKGDYEPGWSSFCRLPSQAIAADMRSTMPIAADMPKSVGDEAEDRREDQEAGVAEGGDGGDTPTPEATPGVLRAGREQHRHDVGRAEADEAEAQRR